MTVPTSEILDRLPPSDIDAERALIGSLFINDRRFDDVAAIVGAIDFYDDANATLFAAVAGLHDKAGSPIDFVCIISYLKQNGDFERVGGAAYLMKIGKSVPNAAHAIHYANIVKARSLERQLIDAGLSMVQAGYDSSEQPPSLIAHAERAIAELSAKAATNTARGYSHVACDALEAVDARVAAGVSAGVSTGFQAIDSILSGLRPSELIIVAGRPSMGKSVLAAQMAEHVAGVGSPVVFVSLEMPAESIAMRLLCGHAGVATRRATDGTVNDIERSLLSETVATMGTPALHIDDGPRQSVDTIMATCRKRHAENPLGLIVVDYLSKIEPDNRRIPRQEQVAIMAGRLKELARELDTPVLVVAQLNRQNEAATDKRPRLRHLRESGAIEQDADVVMLIHRDDYYRDAEFDGKAEVIVAKQRNGPPGVATLIWEPVYTRFTEETIEEF